MRHFAYIDPTTGSMFIQAAIGGFLAVSVAFRKYIKSAFYKVKLALSRQAAASDED
jgi:hypothetical protein